MHSQLFFPLTQPVTTDRAHSLVCIPDRMTAENELTKLQHQYGPRLVKAVIRKDKPSKRLRSQPSTINSQPKTTYTLRYFTRETANVALFPPLA